jgi:excinuclease ABC subunit A
MLETGRHKAIHGLAHLDKVINIDQKAIGRTPRSNPGHLHQGFRLPSAISSPGCRSNMRGIQEGTLFLQRQGWAVRGVQGRRIRPRGDAFPGRCLTSPAKPAAGRPVQRRHSRSAPPKGHSIAEVLDLSVRQAREVCSPIIRRSCRHPRHADRCGTGLYQARASPP